MAHVQIRSKVGGGHSLIVDGMDLSQSVLAEGFSVHIGDNELPDEVHMRLAADVLEVDLPDAVVKATQLGDGSERSA